MWTTTREVGVAMCVNSGNQVFVRGGCVTSYDKNTGSLIKEIKRQCDHNSWICEHSVDPDVIIETCPICSKIRTYNMNSSESADIYTGAAVTVICTGPAGSILGADNKGRIKLFRWKYNSKELELFYSVKTNIRYVRNMCYIEHIDAVVLSRLSSHQVCAVQLHDGLTLWEFNQKINGRGIEPCGLCHDTDGRIYVVLAGVPDIIILDSRTGKLLQHLIEDVELCCDICWTNTRPQLTVLHNFGMKISTFNICGL